MYQYVDRPLAVLDRRERLLLLAMRDWVFAAKRGRCPVEAVSLRFVSHRVVGGIEPFHATMAIIARHGRERLVLSCPCTPCIGEGEAILLVALTGSSGAFKNARSIDHLIAPAHADALTASITQLDTALLLGGMC